MTIKKLELETRFMLDETVHFRLPVVAGHPEVSDGRLSVTFYMDDDGKVFYEASSTWKQKSEGGKEVTQYRMFNGLRRVFKDPAILTEVITEEEKT